MNATLKLTATSFRDSLLSWSWTKRLLHWIVMSAGTMSELAFLIASLWVSVNANVHQFVLVFLDEKTTIHLTELATTAFVALPECIVALAVVTTVGHIRTWLYNKKDYRAWIWISLFGLPTVVFLVLSLVTLGCAVASVTFEMPKPFVVLRALAAFIYAISSLLYTYVGKPQEKDRLSKKDELIAEKSAKIADLETEKARLQQTKDAEIASLKQESEAEIERLHQQKDFEISSLRQVKDAEIAAINASNQQEKTYFGSSKTAEIEQLKQQKDFEIKSLQESKNAEVAALKQTIQELKQLLESTKKQNETLLTSVNKATEDALQAYSEECKNWLYGGVKTATAEEISAKTGHSKRKIEKAKEVGKLKQSPRNPDLITIASLIEWLKETPAIMRKDDPETEPKLRVI